jgi:hypothetical protein
MTKRMHSCAKAVITPVLSFTPVRNGLLQRKCACGGMPGPTGEYETPRKKKLQRRPGDLPALSAINHQPSTASQVPPIVHEVLRSPGQPLDGETRAFMEPRFGHDFSHVRVHADSRARISARAVSALAYTVGRDVVFGAGRYAPATTEGRRLLAHELTHVVQQRSGTSSATPTTQSVAHETEADRVAAQVAADQPTAGVYVKMGTMMAKQDDTGEEKHTLQWPYATARAEREKEWDAPETGLYYNGIILALRRRGEIVFQVGAHSGTSDKDYEINWGPIPDGKQYFLSPHITKPPVKTPQSGDVIGGARGIESGYQQIEVPGPWGKERIAIEPLNVCVPLPAGEKVEEPPTKKAKKKPYCSLSDGRLGVFRGGFYLHGGSGSTTSGCIKVKDDVVFTELRKFGARVPLWVQKHKGNKTP